MEENNEPLENTRDSVLYLVDASESMAESGVLKNSLFLVSKVIRDAAQQGSNKYDAGVILYNVEGENNNTKILLSLKEPIIDDLKTFIRIVSNDDYAKTQIMPMASSKDDSLLNVLRLAKAELNQLHTRSLRRVVIITNNYDPFHSDKQKLKIAINLTSDITNSPASIEPIFLDMGNFNVSTFWGSLNYLPPFFQNGFSLFNPEIKFALDPIDPSTLTSSNQSLVLSKSRKKYVALRGKLVIQGMEVGVKGYNIVQPRSRVPTGKDVAIVAEKSGAEHREMLIADRTMAFASSGMEVDNSETSMTNRCFKLSGAVNEADWIVPINEDQQTKLYQIEQSDDTHLEVEAFIPLVVAAKQQQLYGVVGHSMLIVASNDRLQNSLDAFASLHRSMRRKDVAAIITIHHPSSRRIPPVRGIAYAANPEKSNLFENQRVLKPSTDSGLYFVPLPFEDDLRSHLDDEASDVSNEPSPRVVEALRSLIHKFRLPTGFDPHRFPHPRTAQFSEILEHHALSVALETVKHEEDGHDVPIEQPDPTKPRYQKIARGSGQLLQKISAVYDKMVSRLDDTSSVKRSVGSKRSSVSVDPKVEETPLPPAPKKKKLGKLTDPKILKEVYESGSLGNYTINELMEVLDMFGVPAKKGRKQQVVENVEELVRESHLLDNKM